MVWSLFEGIAAIQNNSTEEAELQGHPAQLCPTVAVVEGVARGWSQC